MPLSIAKRNNYKVLIGATTNAIVSAEFEFNSEKKYTIVCSALGVGEIITVEVYDIGNDTWQNFKIGGTALTLAKDYEVLLLSDVALICRFSKPTTVNPISLVIGTR